MASSLPRTPIFEALIGHDQASTAIVHSHSQRKFTYGELLHDVRDAKDKLLASSQSWASGQRIAYLAENSYDYVGM